jgi:hypothetical protein
LPLSAEAKRARARDLRLQRTYNITSEQYEAMLEYQGGCCAICQLPPRGKLPLNVDHDHKTGLVRGLLCWTCNHRLLPAGRDDPERMLNAAHYLECPPAVAVFGEITAPPSKPKRRKKRTTVRKAKQL